MLYRRMGIGKSSFESREVKLSTHSISSSPSPAPQYDNYGKRINTREYRYRKRLEEERHRLVEKAITVIPSYNPPADYRRPTKTQEKVYVPVNDYPEINFSTLFYLTSYTFSHLLLACSCLRRSKAELTLSY